MTRLATLDGDGRLTPAQAPALATLGATATGEALIEAESAAAARSALGLGGAAVLAVGVTAGTVAAGDDSRITGAVQGSGLDADVTDLDANPASALRVQQDARHLSTFARVIQVISDGTGNSQATRIQAALDSPTVTGERKTVRLVGDFYIGSTTLVIGSHTTLDATDAKITSANPYQPMIRNTEAIVAVGTPTDGSGPRNTDFEIIGGHWVGGGGAGAHHRIFIHQADRFRISGCRMESPTGKYAVMLADVTTFTVRDMDFDVAADGVHVTGPARFGLIENIKGTTGDDVVSIGCTDFTTYDYSRGDISDITVQSIKPTDGGNVVKFFLIGQTLPAVVPPYTMTRMTARDIKGASWANGVTFSDRDSDTPGAYFDDILIDDVAVNVTAGYSQVAIGSGAPAKNVVAQNIRIPAGVPAGTIGVNVTSSVATLTIRGLTTSSAVAVTGLSINDAAAVGRVRLSDVVWNVPSATSYLAIVKETDTVVGDLSIARAYISMSGSSAYPVVINSPGILYRTTFTDVEAETGSSGALLNVSSAIAHELNYSNVRISHGLFNLPNISAGQASITVRGMGFKSAAGTTAHTRSGNQVMRIIAPDFPIPVPLIAANAGDMCWNTSSGDGGVGLAVCNGTTWVNTPRPYATTTANRTTYPKPQGATAYDSTIAKPIFLKTPGTQQVETVTITGAATSSGNITITLNGSGGTVAVTAGDTVDTIGRKIRDVARSNWRCSGSADTVTYTAWTVGAKTAGSFADTDSTGVTATVSTTTTGVAHTWIDATGATV